jgi:hypothetical protein
MNLAPYKHYLGASLVFLTLTLCVILLFRSCVATGEESVRAVADSIHAVFKVTPEITINSQVIQTQTQPIEEMAVAQRDELVTIALADHKEFMNWSIPLTSKNLTAQGTYRIKAGFDLSQPFQVNLNSAGEVHAYLPPPKILSVELIAPITTTGVGDWLNTISDDDRNQLLKALNDKAHEAAESSTLKADAQAQANDRLAQMFKQNKVNSDDVRLIWK